MFNTPMTAPAPRAAAAALLAFTGLAAAQPLAVEFLHREGDSLAGSTITGLGAPVSNGNNGVGIILTLADSRRAIAINGSVVFTSDQAAPDTASGGESTIGISNTGRFIYSPTFTFAGAASGGDAVFGEAGLILVDDTQAPDFPLGFNTTFHSRPTMSDDGTAYWVSGLNDGAGGTSSQSRMIYRRDPLTGAITTILRAGDTVGALTVAGAGGIDFDFAISPNNAHRLLGFDDATLATTANTAIAVNGNVVALELTPTGDGDNWDNFDVTSINDSGNYAFTGDTDGATASDEFLAYNADIILREGQALAGVTLGANSENLQLNNDGQIALLWDTPLPTNSAAETLFILDPTDLSTAVALLTTDDEIDTNNDGTADFRIGDFPLTGISGRGIGFREDGFVYIEVELDDLAGNTANTAAILKIANPIAAACPVDLTGDGVANIFDIFAFFVAFGANDPVADFRPDGAFNIFDIFAFFDAFGRGC